MPARNARQRPRQPHAAGAHGDSRHPPSHAAKVAPPAVQRLLLARPDQARPDGRQERRARQAPSIDLEILFDYKSAEVTPQAAAALTTLGRALTDARLADDSFLIAGHTDAKGGADYNLELSQRRAEAVRQFLIANFRIDAKQPGREGLGPATSRTRKTRSPPRTAASRSSTCPTAA